MKLLTALLTCALMQNIVLGQDKEQEYKFFKDRNKIREARVIEIKKSVAHGSCLKDSSTIATKYTFDSSGNLILQLEYHDNLLRRTITYSRNGQGDYVSKVYTLFDSTGRHTSTEPWIFEFNSLGQRERETWTKNGKPVRVNVLTYDEKGNMTEQFTDSVRKWILKYDRAGNVIETEDWEMVDDSMQCTNRITYLYDNGRLITDIGHVPLENRIWREFAYKYDDNGYLVEIIQKLWMRYGNQPRKMESENSRTVYVNDQNGKIVREELYSHGDSSAWRCYFYDYVYD
jgi:hypothetical protein